MKHSFRRRLNFFFGCIGFAAVCLFTWYGILWHIGNQKNMAIGEAPMVADTLQISQETSATLQPVAFTKLEEPKQISTGKRQSVAPVTHSTKPVSVVADFATTDAEKEAAARLAWIAKRDSLAAVARWRARVAAENPAVEQPTKAKGKKQHTKPKPKKAKKQTPQFVVTKVQPPTAKEIEEQKLWLIMKQETAAVMGGRKDPTAKATPVQNMRFLELMAGKW